MQPTPEYTERFSRQMRFAPIGEAGQEKLAVSRVVLVGCGALGTHIAESLVRAGVGSITLIDNDRVESSNLPRQALFDETDADSATPKAEAAKAHLARINSRTSLAAVVDTFDAANAAEYLDGADLVADGTDNMETRYAINAAAVAAGVPWIYGGVVAGTGAVLAIPPAGPCLCCLYPKPPSAGDVPTCSEIGVIEPAVAVTAALESRAAMRWLIEGAIDAGRLFQFDLWSGRFHEFTVKADPACPVCGGGKDE